jgi:hypothetical protein
MALLVIIRHIPNLRRLLRGVESTVAPSGQAVEGGIEPGAS